MAVTTPRRRRSLARTMTVGLSALLLAALLDADTLDHTARTQPFGWRRDVAVSVTGRLLRLSNALRLIEPRHALEEALDRPSTESPEGPAMPTTSAAPPPTRSTVSSTTTTAPTTTTEPPHRRPTPADPLRVWIAGDSMTEALGPELVDWLEDSGVATAHHDLTYSSGLTRPDYFDWYAEASAAVAELDPEVVVFQVGANDAQGIRTGSGPASFGSDAWVAEYRSRVAAMMDLLGGDGRVVYWVGLPIMRSSTYRDHMALLNRIDEEEAAARPDTLRFVDTSLLLADPNGEYRDYLPGVDGSPVLMRRTDGIHLTSAGADRVTDVVLAAITADFDIAPVTP